MALSNWDTLSFDENGKPSNGVIEGFAKGTSCEIYKNWLYVSDKEMWCKERGYTEPVIAQITQGSVLLSDFRIHATRGPQSSIFVKVESVRYKEQIDGEPYLPPDMRRMAGIGCSGYETPFKLIMEEEGLDPEQWDPSTSGSLFGKGGEEVLTFSFCKIPLQGEDDDEFIEFERIPEPWYETQWVGVKPETYKEFLDWLKKDEDYLYDERYKEWVNKIIKAEPLRFNQGDAFFATNLETVLPSTIPGEADEPIASQIIRSDNENS